MADITECPVCFEEFEDPKLLPCNHTLCLECLENVRKEKSLTCPMCNSKHDVPDTGVVAFSDNPHVTQLIANRKEMRAMKELMESKLKKNKEDDRKCLDGVKEAIEDCSLRDVGAACAPDTKNQKTSKAEASNALTFSRQKLALIQCEYDPKCCGHCKKPASTALSGELKACSKCKTAKYCSRDCQVSDWRSKHRVHCNEIIRLKTMIEQDEATVLRPISPGDNYLHAAMDGNPWLIDRNIEFYNMCIHEGKMFPMGFNIKTCNRIVCMYNAPTGVKEGVVCRLGAPETVVGLSAVEAGESRYLVVAHTPEELKPWRMDFWAYPLLAAEPAYTFRAKPFTLGAIHFSEGNLLVVHPLKQIVEEFNISSFPVKRTGNKIPTGLIPWTNQIRNMHVMKVKQQEKCLLLQYFTDDVESALRCVDYRGRQLWEVKRQKLGDIYFQPEDVCADEDGHVFTLDSRGNRVVVIKPDLSLQVLITTPGIVTSLARCDVTGKLYVSHRNEGSEFQAMVSRYVIVDG